MRCTDIFSMSLISASFLACASPPALQNFDLVLEIHDTDFINQQSNL